MNKALDWAYLAGFVDADGSIVVNRWLDNRYQRHRYITRICISNCDRQIMNWLVSEFGGSVSMANRNAPKNHRTLWRWSLSGLKARPILRNILPYLRLKQKRAELALQFIRTMRKEGGGEQLAPAVVAKREVIFKHITRMNQRGRFR